MSNNEFTVEYEPRPANPDSGKTFHVTSSVNNLREQMGAERRQDGRNPTWVDGHHRPGDLSGSQRADP